jgi:hypothetical protein
MTLVFTEIAPKATRTFSRVCADPTPGKIIEVRMAVRKNIVAAALLPLKSSASRNFGFSILDSNPRSEISAVVYCLLPHAG